MAALAVRTREQLLTPLDGDVGDVAREVLFAGMTQHLLQAVHVDGRHHAAPHVRQHQRITEGAVCRELRYVEVSHQRALLEVRQVVKFVQLAVPRQGVRVYVPPGVGQVQAVTCTLTEEQLEVKPVAIVRDQHGNAVILCASGFHESTYSAPDLLESRCQQRLTWFNAGQSSYERSYANRVRVYQRLVTSACFNVYEGKVGYPVPGWGPSSGLQINCESSQPFLKVQLNVEIELQTL